MQRRSAIQGRISDNEIVPSRITAARGENLRVQVVQLFGMLATYFLVINFIAGTLAALGFILTSSIVLLLNFPSSVSGLKRAWPFLLLPLLAVISSFWSVSPSITLRSSLQLMLTAVFSVAIIQSCSIRKVTFAILLGYLSVVISAGPALPQALANGSPLRGLFESKNAFGIHAQMLSLFAMIIFFDKERGWFSRIPCAFIFVVAMIMTYASRSGGALLLAVLPAILFPIFLASGHLPKQIRVGLLALTCIGAAIAIPASKQLESEIGEFRQGVLGKDATLTGRTDLWAVAKSLEAESPLLGEGYNAFWRQGNPDAEALWRKFGIASRSGFNFHNEFVEIRVGLGVLGLITLSANFAIFIYFLMKSLVTSTSVRAHTNSISIVVLLVFTMRSTVEVFLFKEFSANLFIFVMAFFLLFPHGRNAASAPSSSTSLRAGYRLSTKRA